MLLGACEEHSRDAHRAFGRLRGCRRLAGNSREHPPLRGLLATRRTSDRRPKPNARRGYHLDSGEDDHMPLSSIIHRRA